MTKKDFTQLPYNKLKELCASIYTQHGYTVDAATEQGTEYFFLSKDNKLLFINRLLITPRLLSIPEVVKELNQLRKLGEAYECFNYRIISPYGFQKKAFELEQYNVILSDWKYLVDIQTNQLDIDLFPHNDIAYRKIKEGFENSNRVAVIKPTGTGKSVLISRFLFDYKKEKALIITPSNFIIDQVNKHIDWKNNYDFITYAKTMFLSLKNIKKLQPEIIILDEFHRCGAEEWGKGVEMILNQFPEAMILGTTATPIRHLDNARNMAEELFDNNVAVNLSLNGAIVQRILPTPKYVSALYTLDEEVENIRERIYKSQNEKKDELFDQLKSVKLDWEKAKGIPQIIQKHVPKDARKIIVFTKDLEHLQEMKSKVVSWFQTAGFENIKTYIVHSGQNGNQRIFKQFENAKEGSLHLMFAVDMLNEGVHIKGVDGEIMLRPTESRIIFDQQLGRCLTVSFEKQPIILDLVNNFKNIRTKEFINDYNLEKEKAASNNFGIEDYSVSFSITDETKDITELFESFANSIESFNIFFNELKEFKMKFGHCNVSRKDYPKLGVKVSNIRISYKQGTIDKEHIVKLEELGFVWDFKEYSKEKGHKDLLSGLKKYKQLHGNCLIPDSYSDKWLAQKIITTRNQYRNNRLTEEQIKELEELGFVWNPKKIEQEENKIRFFKELKEFKREFGHVNVPSTYSKKWLRQKVHHTRDNYRKGKLSKKYIKELEEIGFVWNLMDIKKEEAWNKTLKKLCNYKDVFGNCNVPSTFHDRYLANKVMMLRRNYHKGFLPKEQIQQLEEMGFVWKLK